MVLQTDQYNAVVTTVMQPVIHPTIPFIIQVTLLYFLWCRPTFCPAKERAAAQKFIWANLDFQGNLAKNLKTNTDVDLKMKYAGVTTMQSSDVGEQYRNSGSSTSTIIQC